MNCKYCKTIQTKIICDDCKFRFSLKKGNGVEIIPIELTKSQIRKAKVLLFFKNILKRFR
jgi:hypothetical protein